MDHVIIEQLRKEIEKFSPSTLPESVGRVVRSGDGVAEIEGMKDARMMEMVSFDRSGSSRGELSDTLSKTAPIYGLVLNLEEENVKAIILGNPFDVSEGMIVKSTGKLLSLPVSEDIVGRIVDPLGLPLDGKGMLKNPEYRPVERDAYGVILRAGVDTPLHTGLKAIDAMIPIGRGQRELIIGDRFTGKTTIAIDTILNQLSEPKESRPICIYVSIGQKEAKTARIAQLLSDRGAMEYTTIVSASSSAPAAIQFWRRLREPQSESISWIKGVMCSWCMMTYLNTRLRTEKFLFFCAVRPAAKRIPEIFFIFTPDCLNAPRNFPKSVAADR